MLRSLLLAALYAAGALAATTTSTTTTSSDSRTPATPTTTSSCVNSATDRDCWGDYNIYTDYYTTTPDTGVTRSVHGAC
jgi:hypothetical protein